MKALADSLVIAGICIVAIVFAEAGARLVSGAMRGGGTAPSEDPRAALPAYAGVDYDPADYWREFRQAKRERYHPYIVWRQQAFAGELINVDETGRRLTADNADGNDVLDIWMLGGSTMWGMGAPDAQTVPSHVARQLNQVLQIDARVSNLGEIGYVSTQELTQLIRELQTGERPDIVVFLDGVNDAPAAALWPEIPGSHMNLYSIRDRFEHFRSDEPAWIVLLQRTGLYRLATQIADRWFPAGTPRGNWTTPDDPAETVALGERAADIWFSNIRMTRTIGERYGFDSYFFLQPSLLVGEKTLHESEQALVVSERDNAAKRAGMEVYAEMRCAVRKRLVAETPDDVFDRTDLFRAVAAPLYVDYVHFADRGNALLAEEIVASVLNRQCSRQLGDPSAELHPQIRAYCSASR